MDLQREILNKLNTLDSKITAIDTALQGDDSRGVVGIKQHITALKEDFEQHTAHDVKQFGSITERVDRATWIFAGVSLTVSSIIVVAGLIINYYK